MGAICCRRLTTTPTKLANKSRSTNASVISARLSWVLAIRLKLVKRLATMSLLCGLLSAWLSSPLSSVRQLTTWLRSLTIFSRIVRSPRCFFGCGDYQSSCLSASSPHHTTSSTYASSLSSSLYWSTQDEPTGEGGPSGQPSGRLGQHSSSQPRVPQLRHVHGQLDGKVEEPCSNSRSQDVPPGRQGA